MKVVLFNMARRINRYCLVDTVSFTATGKLKWLKKAMWGYLMRSNCLKPAYKETESFARITFEPSKFLAKAIAKHRDAVVRFLGSSNVQILVGPDEFAELASEARILEHFSIDSEYSYTNQGITRVYGMRVTVVPWMEGFLILPDEK